MAKYRVSRGAYSTRFKNDDGSETVYPVRGDIGGGGLVEVDNPVHAREFERRSRESGDVIHKFTVVTPRFSESRVCRPCSFNAFPFQKVCPRCGLPTEEA